MSAKLNKNWPVDRQLRWYLDRQPRAKMIPGYWKGDELVRGPFWTPTLGGEGVNDTEGQHGHSDGCWYTHADAVAAAKRFQEKARAYLAKNNDRASKGLGGNDA